jgi:hypothetical protein
MQPQLSRIPPQMGAAAYKTYEVRSPLATHFRPATCAEVDCPHYLNGWGVRIGALPPETQAEVRAATYEVEGRTYRYAYVEQEMTPGEPWLLFKPGQPCFKARTHLTRMDRTPLYLVRDGDWRGNPRGTRARLHQRPDNWVEDFAEHQQKLADEIEKG